MKYEKFRQRGLGRVMRIKRTCNEGVGETTPVTGVPGQKLYERHVECITFRPPY